MADASNVTAMAVPYGSTSTVAPVDVTALLRRFTGTWSQPEPWIVGLILATGVTVGFRHPIAKMLGTEVTGTEVSAPVVATGPVTPVVVPTSAAAVAGSAAAVPTHAPRNPFRALVGASGEVLAPETAAEAAVSAPVRTHVAKPTDVTSAPRAVPVDPFAARGGTSTSTNTGAGAGAAVGSSTCAGTVHKVVAGDTLWTIAASAVKSSDSARVTVAWHRLYKANKPPLSNPSLIAIGTQICVPNSL